MKRVLIVDDDPYIRNIIKGKLRQEDLYIVEASDGIEAFHKMIDQFFNLIIMDINMPKMNGIETIKALKKININVPIIVVSGIKSKEILRSAVSEGATTYLQKPFEPATLVHVVKQVLQEHDKKTSFYFVDEKKVQSIIDSQEKVYLAEDEPDIEQMDAAKKIVVIGASTGGPKVLDFIVARLSKMVKAAIVIVQHIPFAFTQSLITHLKNASILHCKEAESLEVLREGTIYVAKGGYHTLFSKDEHGQTVILFDDSPPVFSMKPAINPTMISAASIFKDKCLGVVLTGMGVDGTEGAKAIKQAGGKIFAQDEESCDVYGMPKSVVDLKLADEIMPPKIIAPRIVEWSS